ncbi:MAG: thioredoxin family protein [Granulosicoccus sp.]|nr:thioredoxin family protein [Granulosicoccus sp.]
MLQSNGGLKRLLVMRRKKPAKQQLSKPGTTKVVTSLTQQIRGIPRRSLLKSAVLVGGAISIGAGIHLFDVENRNQHDLSVIGAGQPVVVQVHDPSCPSCRQLKRSAEAVLATMPHIHYRIADLRSSAGREIADKYGAKKVTLLLFGGRGNLVATLVGVQSRQQLEAVLSRQFARESVIDDV